MLTKLTTLVACCLLALCLEGCAKRTTFVRPGTACYLGTEIKRADIWVPNEKGELIFSPGKIPEGTVIIVPDVPKKLQDAKSAGPKLQAQFNGL